MPMPRRLAVPVAAAVLTLAGCTGGGDDDARAEGPSPGEVLAGAAETLTSTSGVRLTLSTEQLPEGVAGITRADGIATSDPAFEGTITVVFAGQNVEVPVIAVKDKVHAQIPFAPGWSVVDPAEYGAPDPADMVDPATGFPSLLPQTEGATEGESVRGGANNAEVLTTYTGTLPGDAVKQVIPSSSGDTFDVEWLVTDGGELRQADLTGFFYPESAEMTYRVTFDDYGTEKEIVAP